MQGHAEFTVGLGQQLVFQYALAYFDTAATALQPQV